jgi:hypothetical protein
MPKCNKCEQVKLDEDFNFNKSKNRLEYHCKDCHKRYMKDHYQQQKKYYVDKAGKRNKECALLNRSNILEYLKSHCCVDCGEKEPILLDFDHVRGEKKHNVSNMIHRGYKWETIKAEIDKCEIRCVRCHRIKTYKQFGWCSWNMPD